MAVDHRPACPVHAGFDPLSDEFLADPYAVMASLPRPRRRSSSRPSIDYYVVTALRRHRRGLPRPRDVLGGGGAAAARPARRPRPSRSCSPAATGRSRRW